MRLLGLLTTEPQALAYQGPFGISARRAFGLRDVFGWKGGCYGDLTTIKRLS